MLIQKLLIESPQLIKLPLFRGVSNVSGADLERGQVSFTVRKDRVPLNMSGTASALFNLGIERKFGITDIRKQAVFASMSADVGGSYVSSSIEAGRATSGVVVQLAVPSSAVVVFDDSLGDSIDLQDTFSSEWYDFLTEQGEQQPIKQPELINWYKETTAKQFFERFATVYKLPEALLTEYQGLVNQAADQMVSGYQSMAAAEFADEYLTASDGFECMITNLDSYIGYPIHHVK